MKEHDAGDWAEPSGTITGAIFPLCRCGMIAVGKNVIMVGGKQKN